MAIHINETDSTYKTPGTIGICLFHKYKGIEVEVVERFDEIDVPDWAEEDFTTEDQVWLRRTDGKPFEHEGRNNTSINRHNCTEVVFNEAWVKPKPREWDTEANQ